MIGRLFMLGLGAAGLLAATVPASAQMVDDFLCSTFSYKCNPQPTLPPPQLAPETAPAPAVANHARVAKTHKIRHASVARKKQAKGETKGEASSGTAEPAAK